MSVHRAVSIDGAPALQLDRRVRSLPQAERQQVDAVVRGGVVLDEAPVPSELVDDGLRVAQVRAARPGVEPGSQQGDVGVGRRHPVGRLGRPPPARWPRGPAARADREAGSRSPRRPARCPRTVASSGRSRPTRPPLRWAAATRGTGRTCRATAAPGASYWWSQTASIASRGPRRVARLPAPEQPDRVPGGLADEVHRAGRVRHVVEGAGRRSTAAPRRRPTPGPSRRWRPWWGRSSSPELEGCAVPWPLEREAHPVAVLARGRVGGAHDVEDPAAERRAELGGAVLLEVEGEGLDLGEVPELLQLPRDALGDAGEAAPPCRRARAAALGSSSRRTTPSGAETWASQVGVSSPRQLVTTRARRPVSKCSCTSACSSTGWSAAPSSVARTSTGTAGAASSSATASGCTPRSNSTPAAPTLGEEVAPRRVATAGHGRR